MEDFSNDMNTIEGGDDILVDTGQDNFEHTIKEAELLLKEEEEEEEDSELYESNSSLNSAEARERAVRDGFLGFLFGYLQNDFFQKLLGYLAMVWEFMKKKVTGKSDEEEGDEAVDLAEEVFDAVDPLGNTINSAGGGPTGGSGGGGGGAAAPGKFCVLTHVWILLIRLRC